MFQRDPIDHEVSIVLYSADPKKNPYYADTEFGEVRTTLTELIEQERRTAKSGTQSPLCPRPAQPPSPLKINPSDPILVPNNNAQSDPEPACSNSLDRAGMQLAPILPLEFHPFLDNDSPFMNQFAQLCCYAKIRRCHSRRCVDNWKRLEGLAPGCDWQSFREWALQLVSCQAIMAEERRYTRAFYHLQNVVTSCHCFLVDAKTKGVVMPSNLLAGQGKTKASVDAFGVFEIVYWMLTIQVSLGDMSIIEQGWSADFLPADITEPAVIRASQQAKDMGICLYRLWNLVFATERQHLDLPAIMEAAVRHPQLKHQEMEIHKEKVVITTHEICTSVYCKTTAMDSTRVKQLHKCREPLTNPCKDQLLFEPQLLNDSIRAGGRTVWSVSTRKISQHEPYIAISHVWSDGTGVGLQKVGLVNQCLFESLARIAQRLDCLGIWWDAISIPGDPGLRRTAINNMHDNYAAAKCTVLHDQYLLNFEWTDDGAPCLAIIFSPWLTRGWTALELIMSKTVKVLFKDPNGGEPLIKDLDKDVLAKSPAKCTRGHWVASTIIRRLRQDIHNVSDLIAVLKPRSTSWARDRMVIAGLLSGITVDYKQQPHEITKMILDKVTTLNRPSLYHGQPTITESGGWSWCPTSFLDMPSDTVGDLAREGAVGDGTCMVDGNGVLAGFWYWRPLEKEDSTSGNLLPNSRHVAITLNTMKAIRRWEYCMLLRDSNSANGLALIVIPIRRDKEFIHVKFVGSVREVASKYAPFDERFDFEPFKIGAVAKDGKECQEMKAVKLYKKQKYKNPSKPFTWICGKLWIGDHEDTGQLLVARRLKGGIIEGYSLKTFRTENNQGDGSDDKNGRHAICPSDDPVFRVWAKSGLGVHGEATDNTVRIRRVTPEESWPPMTIPSSDRIFEPSKRTSVSLSLFTLKMGAKSYAYSAINPKLLTSDEKHPYRGIWTYAPNNSWCLIALFHQPYPSRLEVIALTGEKYRPRGGFEFVAEDLADIKRVYGEEGKWKGRPVVSTTLPVPDNMPPPAVRIELLLAAENEVVFMPQNGKWTHFHRVRESEYQDLLAAE